MRSSSAIPGSSNNNDPKKRRVLLPSLGGGRKPLGTLAGPTATSDGETSQQQQNQRRDSYDEQTQGTLQTHSSASNFSSSTISGSSGGSITGRIRGGGVSAKKSNNNGDNGEHTSNSISSNISYTKSYERVLRYGETVDSLFCLTTSDDNNSDGGEYHKTLCLSICNGDKSYDVNVWREALELSLEVNNNNSVGDNIGGTDIGRFMLCLFIICYTFTSLTNYLTNSLKGKRLILLFRRATSRFKLTTEKEKSVLQIWLLYALVLLKYGSGSDHSATQTLKHVQRMYFGKRSQDFYNALVQQHQQKHGDADVDGVVTLLEQTLGQGTSVVEIVRSQMSRLEGLLSSSPEGNSSAASVAPVRQISLPSLGSKKIAASRQTSFPSSTRANSKRPSSTISTKLDDNDKPSSVSSHQRTKRPLKSSNTDYSSLGENGDGGGESSGIKPSLRAKLESRKKMKTSDRTTGSHPRRRTRKRDGSVGSGKGGGLRAILSQTLEEEDDDSDNDGHQNNSNYVMAKRSADSAASTVTAKRSADSCMSAASSTANDRHLFQDISPIDQEPTTSVKDMDLDYLLNWDPTKRSDGAKSKKRVTIAEDAKKQDKEEVKKITKNDLGYMMNWNPFDKFEKKEDDDASDSSNRETAGGVVVVQQSTAAQPSNMSTIDEATEGSISSGEGDNNAITSQSRASSSSQESKDKTNNSESMRKSRGSVGTNASRIEENEKSLSSSTTTTQENMISASKLDCSFLPLIEKKNIVRVEDESYAKLGVIGKGGSCKVYRALSRDCDVVALKKVKLDGLNKAAIDGYANEIALLKRLKGNPAIIQLYSAEVDLERKSILLVMELGEVDLNYVLRQQELISSKQQGRTGRSSLNMNFIRLTWQQMLTAVHSIHEERIIHSDLKPAVRRRICIVSLFPC